MKEKLTPGTPGELAHEGADGFDEMGEDKGLGTPAQLHPKEAPSSAPKNADPYQKDK